MKVHPAISIRQTCPKKGGNMTIDFIKFEKMIPEKGSLTIVIMKKEKEPDKLVVIVAPKFPKKNDDPELSPLRFTDNAENLTKEFENIEETVKLMHEYADIATVSNVTSKRNIKLKSTIDKAKADQTKTTCGTEEKKEEKEKIEESPLFAASEEKPEEKKEAACS